MSFPIHWLTKEQMVTYGNRGRGMVGILTDGNPMQEASKELCYRLSQVDEMRAVLERVQAYHQAGMASLPKSLAHDLNAVLFQSRHVPKHGELLLGPGRISVGDRED